MKTEKNILVAFLLNIGFSIFELIGGIFTGSIAILSDSLHDLGDALSIGLSYFLERKSKQKADNKHTYGYVRYSVMGSVITTVILLVGSIFVIIEAIKRFVNPVEINYDGMIIFAVFGVIVNSLATYFTKEGDSLNQKSVNLHMLEDVLGWVVVLIGSILMRFTDITYIDSILSIGVSLFILVNALMNLKEIVDLFLEKTPEEVDIEEIKKHVRSIDGYNNFATLHVVVNKYDKEIKHKIKEELEEHKICHSTIELELKDEKCDEVNCEVKQTEHHHHHHH